MDAERSQQDPQRTGHPAIPPGIDPRPRRSIAVPDWRARRHWWRRRDPLGWWWRSGAASRHPPRFQGFVAVGAGHSSMNVFRGHPHGLSALCAVDARRLRPVYTWLWWVHASSPEFCAHDNGDRCATPRPVSAQTRPLLASEARRGDILGLELDIRTKPSEDCEQRLQRNRPEPW